MTNRVFLLTAILFAPALLSAGIIYNDFGTDIPYRADSGVVVSGATDERPSFAFTTGTNQFLSEVDFVTSIGNANDLNQVTITLSNDSSGSPGTVIDSHEFDGAMGIGGDQNNPPPVLSWILSGTDTLTAGTQYWITFDAPAPGDVTWNGNTTMASGDSTFGPDGWVASDSTIGALRILGTDGTSSVPEPATLPLFSGGLLGLALLTKTRFRSK